MTLYSAIYLLLPVLTNGARLYSDTLANVHFWAHLLGGIGIFLAAKLKTKDPLRLDNKFRER